MKPPPLPDIFGNYALKDFTEVSPPDSISWLPQTAGWLWLGAIALLFCLRYLWRVLRHWYQNRYRREAVQRLQALSESPAHTGIVADINKVLKITALVAYSRDSVARLSGEQWVNFLNRQCAQPTFNREQAELLATATYRQQEINQGELDQLIAAGLSWVNLHRSSIDV